MDRRKILYGDLKEYVFEKYRIQDEDEIEKIFSGVLAFIAVQIYHEPYEVLMIKNTTETKKWWQFWK